MSKEKQIEEMAECLRHVCEGECVRNQDGFVDCEVCKSHHLYNAGYRKQIESRWTFKGTAYGCSICGEGVIAPIYNYCPNCGAKMKGGAE